ncbi:hypothetical protein [Telmatospirillum siberiense]|uniref:YtxH domain-containing protein n=1 Tax=Telmatospirillum siberiense TaxID=382514 RepID=A0A2N3PWG3_9PROT|nr:hypothetical protein [Telmatospirillum siberiense]PKU24754.1 hypothetical protein CWS72_10315 [Telmatospirillum siberiense]
MAKKKQKKAKNGGKAADRDTARQTAGQGLFAGLLPSRRSEQFLLGALLGAAAAYVLSDEDLRGKLIKGGLRLYSGLAGGFEEMKEQVADLKAEMAAEQSGLL